MAVIVGQGISVSPVPDAKLSHESTGTVQNKAVADAIAAEYSTSKTYSVGDVCTHDGKLYECIVDIPTAEGWTLAHWKVSNLGDNVSNLNRQLSDLQPAATSADVGKALIVKTVDTQTGKPTSYEYGEAGGGSGGGGMNIVNLSGTQITQVGADNTFYVCGELTELTFTAPAVGITMIRFTSGSTPTVLTVNGVTSWMFDNDPTAASLEANKTYDINVLNGVGVVGWA